jgi:hypothetical protein
MWEGLRAADQGNSLILPSSDSCSELSKGCPAVLCQRGDPEHLSAWDENPSKHWV